MFEVIPAIDLKDGLVVRLQKGDMKSAKVYSEHPAAFAQDFEKQGARSLHIVDLDGAFAGTPKNKKAIEEIVLNTSLSVEIGGGIRDEKTIEEYLALGIERVILGSAALKDPQKAKEWAQKYPIAIGIDARDGKVAIEGWAQSGDTLALDLAKQFANSAVQAIICTDISRDGMLSGVNIDFVREIAKASGLPTIASGGVANLNDIENLTKLEKEGIAGAILGKSIYEKTIELKAAIELVAKLSR